MAQERKWRRQVARGQGFTDVSYEYVEGDKVLATIAEGGKSGYRWTVYFKGGQRGFDSAILAHAKAEVERVLA